MWNQGWMGAVSLFVKFYLKSWRTSCPLQPSVAFISFCPVHTLLPTRTWLPICTLKYTETGQHCEFCTNQTDFNAFWVIVTYQRSWLPHWSLDSNRSWGPLKKQKKNVFRPPEDTVSRQTVRAVCPLPTAEARSHRDSWTFHTHSFSFVSFAALLAWSSCLSL